MARKDNISITSRPMNHGERVVEFSTAIRGEHGLEAAGGLISFQVTREGVLKIELYRMDPNVVVVAPTDQYTAQYIPAEYR